MTRKKAQTLLDARETQLLEGRFAKRRAEYRQKLAEWYEVKCCNCESIDRIVIDHVVPLSQGGINHIVNMQFLCWSCNRHKDVKTIDYRPAMLVRIMRLAYFQRV